jgi:hypothetical protein
VMQLVVICGAGRQAGGQAGRDEDVAGLACRLPWPADSLGGVWMGRQAGSKTRTRMEPGNSAKSLPWRYHAPP